MLLVGNKGDVTAAPPAADGAGDAGEGQESSRSGTGSGGERREVEREEAEKWAEEEGLAGYVETSAKSGAGVEEVRTSVLSSRRFRTLLPDDSPAHSRLQAFNTLTRLVHARQQKALADHRARTKSSGSTLGVPGISLTGGGGGSGGGASGGANGRGGACC